MLTYMQALVACVAQHISSSIDRSCSVAVLRRKSLFGEHYAQLLEFARISVASAEALQQVC